MWRSVLRRAVGLSGALSLALGASVAGAWAGARLGVDVRVALPSLCTAELRRGTREIAIACLHRDGFVLHARNRRSSGDLVLRMGAFRTEIPPGERRRIADSGGPSAGRLPIRLSSVEGRVSAADLALEIEPR
ncbi:MAG: hypothetical protein AAF676_00910 [Pseudomonadota bacterium]